MYAEYVKRVNEDESKENNKKRRLCETTTGCADCEQQEQPLKSHAKGADHEAEDIDNLNENDNERENEDESKENNKKRRLCETTTGCADCEQQEQPLKSHAKGADHEAEDIDNLNENDNEARSTAFSAIWRKQLPPSNVRRIREAGERT
ncbi:hypothetical protein MTO96_051122 [Rhipicephalus appendiculatus]